MASTQLEILSDRLPSGMIFLSGSVANVDGDADESFYVPASFGDCLVFSDECIVTSIATLVANPELLGVRRYLGQPGGGSLLGAIGVTRWSKVGAANVATSIEYMRPHLLRVNELYTIQYQEVDTNATPAGDLRVTLYVQRLRNLGT